MVIEFNFQWQVSRTVYRKYKASLSGGIMSLQDSPYLKAGITFAPHGSSVDMIPENKSSEAREIVGRDQHLLHTNITLQQLGEIMLPKAMDYFCQNAEATVYPMVWKSKHGDARIQVERQSMRTLRTSLRTRRTIGEPTKRKLFQGQGQEVWSWTQISAHLLHLWSTHAPIQLQRPVMDWIQKEREIQFADRKGKSFRKDILSDRVSIA
jgi:hypothetical protein